MRIRSLDLLAFGPFQKKTLTFANDGGVEVVRRAHARAGAETEWLDALGSLSDVSDADLVAMGDEALADLRSKLPVDLTHGTDALRLDDVTVLRGLLEEAQQAILVRARDAEQPQSSRDEEG